MSPRRAALVRAHAALAAALATKAHVPGDAPEDHEDNTFGLPEGAPLRRKLRAFFREQLKRVVGFVGQVGAEIPAHFPRLADYNDAMASAMTPILGTYWDRAGKGLRGRLGLDPAEWRVTDPNLHRMIAAQSLKFCAATNATTDLSIHAAREAVRQRLRFGLIGEGDTIPELTAGIREIFARASKERAVRIARTEAARAVHAASLESARQSGVVAGKRWLLSANSCPVCHQLAAAAESLPLDGEFGRVGRDPEYASVRMPPAHPNCRCSVTYTLIDEAVPAVPAFVPASRPPGDFPDDPDSVAVVRKLGGSTGAELVRDAHDRLFVRKRGASPDHLREEAIADDAYRALGVDVPESRIYETRSGPIKLAKFVPGRTLAEVRKADPALAAKAEATLREGFAADALLGNWDVIGLGSDNVLIDARGRPWRVDNGGSLRFRAQGDAKAKGQWDTNPREIWTLRDPKVNPSAAAVFGPLGFDAIAAQVEGLAARSRGLKLPGELAGTVADRLAQMRELVSIGRTLRADKFTEGYADDFVRHTCGLRAAGISARMPARLARKASDAVEVFDEQGRPWDHLRGKGSLVEGLAAYVAESGGNYEAARAWMKDQAGDSWNAMSQALKYHLAVQRGGDFGEYWWKAAPAECRKQLDLAISKAGGTDAYATAMTSLHAFTREYLARADFEGKAPDGTVRLMRTENAAVMKGAGLKPGDRDVKLKRGVAESTSIYREVTVFGTEVTVQQVPIHRVVATYWQERAPGAGSGAFLGDRENEFLAILDDLPIQYRK